MSADAPAERTTRTLALRGAPACVQAVLQALLVAGVDTVAVADRTAGIVRRRRAVTLEITGPWRVVDRVVDTLRTLAVDEARAAIELRAELDAPAVRTILKVLATRRTPEKRGPWEGAGDDSQEGTDTQAIRAVRRSRLS